MYEVEFPLHLCAVQTGAKAKGHLPFLVLLLRRTPPFLSSRVKYPDVPWAPQMRHVQNGIPLP